MLSRSLALFSAMAFLLNGALAAEARESEVKPKETPVLDAPTDEELDKPAKAGVRRPRAMPLAQGAETPGKGKDKPDHVNPFRTKGRRPKYAVPARITYSDGKTLEGWVWRRANAPIRIFDRKDKAHEDYFLGDLRRIAVKPESTTFERDWRWKNQGSSEKVFLDVGYFWDQYVTTFTVHDGRKPAGDCSGQFYMLLADDTRTRWYLYKRQSGRDKEKKKREELAPLVYVKSVEFTDDFLKKPKEQEKKGAAEAEKKATK